ncbi:major facilitator superfamily protein, putative [Ichthyophthirius multifiliis]|uniref:Major facilitator superfamily protein, putative n=1 Tax=Ichthyophthirius multifiliis TaxID=5932 RepID=G0QQD9_ICHMU|nr:major facilitator superfamily protein, putative [Ichthyophthirius multifiliis]EGR32568.1 major facilitator superfamily protein, putative [Ichthyophthirius multifiliis]|eukprot:XP_004036554.1 major facilitator superfamily protein, putative [Ichthyophthirius multifiliis]
MQEPLLNQDKVIKILGIDRNLLFLSLLNFFLNATVSLIVPFYPTIATIRGVNATITGLVFSMNPVGSFLISFYIGSMMERLGKKQIMFWSMLVQVLTVVTFGLIYYINDKTTFIIVSMVTRFIQGASRSAYVSVTFGYVPQLWPNTVQQKLAIMETLTAIGLLLGPVVGQALNNLISLYSDSMGYQMPFYFFGLLFIIMSYTIRWLPKDQKNKKEIDYVSSLTCMKNCNVLLTFFLVVTASTSTSYINPLYSGHMDQLGLSKSYNGYLFSLGALSYMIFLYIIPQMSKVFDKKVILSIGLLMCTIGCLIMGAEEYLGFSIQKKQWYLVTIGQCIIGAAMAMCVIPIIQEFVELILKNELKIRKQIQPDMKLIRACSDMAAGIFVGGYSLGIFIGPTFGGLMLDTFQGEEIFRFQKICRVFALVSVIVLVLYLSIGGGYQGYKNIKIFQKKKKVETQSSQNNNNTDDNSQTNNINVNNNNNISTIVNNNNQNNNLISKQKLSDNSNGLQSDNKHVNNNYQQVNEDDNKQFENKIIQIK